MVVIVELEINCIVACVVFIGSILSDCISALDSQPKNNAPSSMRCSSIILVACLASPPIRQRYVFVQRFILAASLALVSLVGKHDGGKEVRVSDIIFSFLIGMMTLSSYIAGGTEYLTPNKMSLSKDAPTYTKRETVCALAISFLFYSGCRIVRQCIVYAENVNSFTVTTTNWAGEEIVVPGYAHMDVASILSIGIGGVVAVALSALLLASNTLREVGTGAKRDIILICGFFQFAAAFWATVALSEQQQTLVALFSQSACRSSSCPAAGTARRFAMLNGNPTTIWINALGTFILAYGPDDSNKQLEKNNMGSVLNSSVVVIWGLLSTVACSIVVFAYSSFSGPGIYVEISTLVALAAIPISAFWNSSLGAFVFLIGIGYDELVSILNNSLLTTLTYLTHCSILVGVIALTLRTLVSMIVELVWAFFGSSKAIDVLDDVIGIFTIAGVSIFTFLYLATSCLFGTYDGLFLEPSSYEDGPQKYARSLIAAVLEHWIPILIFLPLYRSRQVTNIAFVWKIVTWIGSVALAILIWVVSLTLAGRDADHADVYTWGTDAPFVLSIFLLCIVSWGSVGLI